MIPTTYTATRNVDQLILNPKNPRGIKEADYERLKKQIQKLGMYKPVIIDQNNKVLGGNMRVRAYKELGITDIWVSVVDTKQGQLETDYVLSDNNSLGYNELDDLAELITDSVGLDLDIYKVSTMESVDLSTFLNQQSGNGLTEDKESEEIPTGEKTSQEMIECPRCKLKFQVKK